MPGSPTLQTFVMATLTFSVIITGMTVVNGGVADQNGQNIDQDVLGSMTHEQEVAGNATTARKRAQDLGGGIQENFFYLGQVWDAIKTVFSAQLLWPKIILDATTWLPIPDWLNPLLLAVPGIIVVWALIFIYRGA